MEMAPYRELLFTLEYNGEPYTIVLRHLLLGRPDIVEGTLFILAGLLVLIYLMMFLAVNRVAQKHWKPFYVTLNKLSKYNPEKPVEPLPITPIEEFNYLNTSINRLFNRIERDFRNMKEYNENASHELQTHLAVIKGASENMLNSMNEEADFQLRDQIRRIHTATTQLSYIQRSLLLLSRIGNHEFNDVKQVNLREIVEITLSNFEEMVRMRGIELVTDMEDCIITADVGLMKIMINNLLKNAVKYNVEQGFLKIKLDQEKLVISNSGEVSKKNTQDMIHRYARGEKGNLGIGLSIVNQICEINQFFFQYLVVEKNIHQIEIFFPKA
jgi:signal transduction histidine kinase